MTSIPRPCLDCGALVAAGVARCRECARDHEAQRGSTVERFGSGWAGISAAVLRRDGYECQLRLPGCTGEATTADHVIPRSQGGTATLDNLQASCRHCNSSKGKR
jgi:5-methylcytosine-specific restriction endonuclease McrA